MWLSTVQSFKILRRVKKNFESNVMKEMKSKCRKRYDEKRRNVKEIPTKQEAIKTWVIAFQKNQQHFCLQQNIIINKDVNLKSIS